LKWEGGRIRKALHDEAGGKTGCEIHPKKGDENNLESES
jgi:hypothetical protein